MVAGGIGAGGDARCSRTVFTTTVVHKGMAGVT